MYHIGPIKFSSQKYMATLRRYLTWLLKTPLPGYKIAHFKNALNPALASKQIGTFEHFANTCSILITILCLSYLFVSWENTIKNLTQLISKNALDCHTNLLATCSNKYSLY